MHPGRCRAWARPRRWQDVRRSKTARYLAATDRTSRTPRPGNVALSSVGFIASLDVARQLFALAKNAPPRQDTPTGSNGMSGCRQEGDNRDAAGALSD